MTVHISNNKHSHILLKTTILIDSGSENKIFYYKSYFVHLSKDKQQKSMP